MNNLEHWRFSDTLTVIQAALLIIGDDPETTQDYIEQWEPEKRPKGYDAAKSALIAAINSQTLIATIGWTELSPQEKVDWADIDESVSQAQLNETQPNLHETWIRIEHLKKWLEGRKQYPAFFFVPNPSQAAYLDPKHESYSLKLAAAIKVWQALHENPELMKPRKSPKSIIESWLRNHAEELGLVKDDGEINGQGVEQISKVVNWATGGGAPKQ